MGAWGGGLYDSDFARDLKGLIKGIWRAPLSDDEILAEMARRSLRARTTWMR